MLTDEELGAARARIGGNIRAAREARGMSRQDLASASGLNRSYVWGVENGSRNPGVDSIVRICRALGTSFHELLDVL